MQERDRITLGSFDILQIFDWKCTFTEIRVALHKLVAFLVGASEGGLTIVFLLTFNYVSLFTAQQSLIIFMLFCQNILN